MMSASWASAIRSRIDSLDQARLRRQHRIAESPQGPLRQLDGRQLLTFASNDYLGLAAEPVLAQALRKGVDQFGVGSGAAHLLGGHSSAHQELQEKIADWVGRERALLFSTGYMANLGLVSGLCGRHQRVIADRLNHASLIDAARLSGARHLRYRHGDVAAAKARIQSGSDRALLVTDGVFSMDGDLAPLVGLAGACNPDDVLLCVDDAHGFGVLGREGAGTCAHLGLDSRAVPVLVGTLGKALGTFGAFVAGDADLIEALIHDARSYLFTTAPPPALAAASSAAVDLARSQNWRREKLHAMISRFRSGTDQLGLSMLDSDTPIQPLILGSVDRALQVSAALLERGIWVPAVRPPTVPTNSARLRITLSAAHEEDQVDRLLAALDEVLA